jgi:hypothetical protein
LNGRQKILEIVLKASNSPGARDVGGKQLLDARIAGAHHREFSGHKKGIGQNQHGDSDNLEKRQTVHPGCEDSIRHGSAQLHAHHFGIWRVTAMAGTNRARHAYPTTATGRTETGVDSASFLFSGTGIAVIGSGISVFR